MPAPSDPALAAGVALPDGEAVLELFRRLLVTAAGQAELARLRFHRDPESLHALHARLAEAQHWLARYGPFAFSALEDDARPWLAAARVPGAVLAPQELLGLQRFLEGVVALRRHVLGPEGDPSWPALTALAAAIAEFTALRGRFQATFLPGGEINDNASPELARLRRRRQRQRQAIETAMARHLRALGAEGALQDELVTVRNDRFVLPVRVESRRRAPGVVHGASATGQTLFVEPLDTVELNNDYIRIAEDEQAEIQRILAALTAEVAEQAPAIAAAAEAAGVLELEAAKARFAREFAAIPAEFGAALELVEARHPVLVETLRGRHPVVPLSLALGSGPAPARLLVVSGPNTGGKTVVLKTVGIAVWMAQSGLPVCARRACLPVFDSLWADIGDVQSLQASLSTFSSHLVNIRGILAHAGERSLVLLDELGAATNPAEGAALAIAIAESLAHRRVWALISTHHDDLKAWAAAHPESVLNGSVAVDPETLAPSYLFRLGVPGVSAGLDMAARLGLPPELIAAARARLGEEQVQAARYLERLQQQLAEAEERLGRLDRREQAVARREEQIAAHDRSWMQKHLDALRAEMSRRLQSAEEAWRKAIAAMEDELTHAQKRKLGLEAARLRRETEAALQEADSGPAAPPPTALPIAVGARVRLRSSSRPAVVLRRSGDDSFEVQAGSLRLRVSRADIASVLDAPPPALARGGVATPEVPESPAILELNLIGLRAEEAREQLDKFLDQATLASADQVRIVHGAGFGVLRKVVAETLRAHPHIARFEHPPQNQGGAGVTLAEMK